MFIHNYFLAFSTASSIVPTYANASSGYSSISPSNIALNPATESSNDTYLPSNPVNCVLKFFQNDIN